MDPIFNFRITFVFLTVSLCSCQNTGRTFPADAQVAVVNGSHFPEYAWGGHYEEPLTPPELISQVPAIYPVALEGSGLHGSATIGWVIETNGSTSHVQVLAASNRYFGEAAKRAVENWIFKPAQSNGKAVVLISEQLFKF